VAPEREERRLAAILAADMVGYSRLMEADETATIARQRAHRAELVDPEISAHNGRIVKTTGDGLLVEFASVVDAVDCAAAIQRAMAGHETDIAEDRRIRYRIGVNLGDIVIDGEDILGDGVNVAARLEGLAEPGGICIPRKVLHEIRNKLDLGYAFIGEKKVKNIEAPVPVYRVLLEPEAAGQVIGEGRSGSPIRRLGAAAALGLALLIVIVGALLWRPWTPSVGPTSTPTTAIPIPDKPSIAVLPFTNLSNDPEQEYFSDGISEDLTTDLSRISGLFVIARNSAFAYKGEPTDVKQIGRELGVRYLLEGSVRRSGGQVRINAQLIDATTGGHVWAERYDGALDDLFTLQDRVTKKIIGALAVELTSADEARVTRTGPPNVAAHDAYLQGRAYAILESADDYAKAIPYFERAIELDPTYGQPYAALATLYYVARIQGWRGLWKENDGMGSVPTLRRVFEYQGKALEYPTARAHALESLIQVNNGRFEEAIAEAERAIALNPNDPVGHVRLGLVLTLAGDPAKGIERIETAIRLDPHYPPSYLLTLGLAYFGLEKFDDAAAHFERGLERSPELSAIPLVAAYGHLGRNDEASRRIEAIDDYWKKWRPGYPLSIRRALQYYRYKDPADTERMAEGLRKAGMT
jgi:TolB-like protein/class 3 adenylate cyclase